MIFSLVNGIMFFHVAIARESFKAHVALERPLPSMLSLMDDKVHLGVVPLGASWKPTDEFKLLWDLGFCRR